jgi:hypothetical protein
MEMDEDDGGEKIKIINSGCCCLLELDESL